MMRDGKKCHDRGAWPRNNIGVTAAVAAIAIRSKAIRLEFRGEIGVGLAPNRCDGALLGPESEDISMQLSSPRRFEATRIQGRRLSSKALAVCKLCRQ